MKTILRIIVKEFLQFKRDKRMLGLNFISPIIQITLLGYAASLDIRSIPLSVCDLDRTRTSREFVEKFTSSGYFSLTGFLETAEDINDEIVTGRSPVCLVIPHDFSEKLLSGRQAPVQAIFDGSDSNSATIGLGYTAGIISQFSQNILIERMSVGGDKVIRPVRIDNRVRVWYNPELKSRLFMIPGIFGLLLLVLTSVLTSLAIVKEKELGTLEQLIVTPIKPYQLIIGKLTPFTIVGLIDVGVVLGVMYFLFGITVRGSIPLLYALCAVYLLTTLGLGLFVSTVSKTQQQAMMTAIFFVMMPMMFLSGFVFPIDNMPYVIQLTTYLMPLRYFFEIVRGIIVKGSGIAELWDEALILFIFGIAILALSTARFKKTLE